MPIAHSALLLALGLLTLLGLSLTNLSTMLITPGTVPATCRRRVDLFVRRTPVIRLAALAATATGTVLLLLR